MGLSILPNPLEEGRKIIRRARSPAAATDMEEKRMFWKKTLISWLAVLTVGFVVAAPGAMAHKPHKLTILAGFPG